MSMLRLPETVHLQSAVKETDIRCIIQNKKNLTKTKVFM